MKRSSHFNDTREFSARDCKTFIFFYFYGIDICIHVINEQNNFAEIILPLVSFL